MGGDSRFVVDENGRKWRLCAGVAVLNSSNEILIGERIHQKGSWQTPQGGVSEGETVEEAAHRELYEETGLILDKHVMLENLGSDNQIHPTCYETGNTNSWLTQYGFAGQQLHWTIYRCIDGRGDKDASSMCSLEGKNGEPQEFIKVKWAPVEHVVENVWPAKRAAYEELMKCLQKVSDNWSHRLQKLDFSGKWSRDASRSIAVAKALQARGLSSSRAEDEASSPYVQKWSRESTSDITWIVTQYGKDAASIRRELTYKIGEWEEDFPSGSTILGDNNQPTTVLRRTTYVAEPQSDPEKIAHLTLSTTPSGIEEARRYFKGDTLILQRKLWLTEQQLQEDECITSTEVFSRI
mmetsp:Transcript_15195/g.18803  ORF Transcript_15195/g.18803 Transcript_15195/m.18803 type:complete len:352 (-) Transcript_15195:1348-2403(-)|eukprot:CAMPEP_0204840264 /NCGR_PEP_ID=MMETSP1346-20131115/37043_1 /ASSEMBLY_ACC=CAM_ASM_000771 /TAXON_ID=215587 /ORGANISM="Aplanochytrium stocchinoi, Strain GSBS06" /LENGTH=351 /DNA_ID=CAMNT_0051977533 /DNA_START=87 /DNA_END=1142 /DNA_ORIENTATION=+